MPIIAECRLDRTIHYEMNEDEYAIISAGFATWQQSGLGKPTVKKILDHYRKTIPTFGKNIKITEIKKDPKRKEFVIK